MIPVTFQGNPTQIGTDYGNQLAPQIRQNLSVLIWREGYEPLPREDSQFLAWMKGQEETIGQHWPWLLEEMKSVATAIEVDYEDILLLNLRAWQYSYYGSIPPASACSTLAITLKDGSVVCAGAFDDPADYYCGPVGFAPNHGYSFMTFPLTGTSWGSRGINSEGLTAGISSQILVGLRRLPHAVNQDLAMRVILQTCVTVEDVRQFCQKYPFTLNLVCVDAEGAVFCAHNTAAGLLEFPVEGACALTNHVADDGFLDWLRERGVTEYPESPTTRFRRGKLLRFIRERNGKCSEDEVKQFIGKRDDDDLGSIHNIGTLYLTYVNPRSAKKTFWVREPQGMGNRDDYVPFEMP